MLRIVGKTLMGSVKGHDTTARYGGEEFAVILPNTPLAGALALAEQLRKSISQKKLVKRGSEVMIGPITMSFGIARYVVGEAVSDLIERADKAMYKAKAQGRNRVVSEEACRNRLPPTPDRNDRPGSRHRDSTPAVSVL